MGAAMRFYHALLGGAPAVPYIYDYNPTEGSGTTITDKNGSGINMTTNGTWSGNALLYTTTGILNFTYGHATNDVFLLAPQSTMLLYFKARSTFTVGASGDGGWLCGRQPAPGGWVGDHKLTVQFATGKFGATVHVDPTGSPANTDVSVQSTTVVAANGEYCVGLTHDASTLKLWVNGVVEASASAGISQAPATGRYVIVGGGSKPFSSEVGLHQATIGRFIVANGALSDTAMAALYAEFQTEYPGLP